jgi:predicted aspartyl protease
MCTFTESGQHLGLPIAERLAVYDGRKWADCQQFNSGSKQEDAANGTEYIISQSFHAENMPSQGKLKLLITGKNIRVDCATDYGTDTNEYITGGPVDLVSQPQSIVSSTKAIKCRRDGNHLWVPVEIGSGESVQQAELLLDTGASITCIPPDIYEKLRLKDVKHEEIELETANGQISADTVILSVKTSAFQRDIRVAFNSSNKLLGVNYFADCIFTVDVLNECIYVKRNGVQLDEYQTLTGSKK